MTSAARRTAAISALGFSSAFAERDRFGGDGHHGARVVSTANVQVNASTVVSGPASAAPSPGVVQLLDAGLRLPAVEITAPAPNSEREETRPAIQGTATPG